MSVDATRGGSYELRERALRSVKENIITTTPLFKKLNLGERKKILVLNSPESFEAEIA